MSSGTLHFGSPEWFWAVAALVAASLGLAWWNSRRGQWHGASSLVGLACRSLALILIGLAILNPVRTLMEPRSQANQIALLIDNSESLQLSDRNEKLRRADRLMEAINPDAKWLTGLSAHFQMRQYEFDSRVHGVDPGHIPDFQGRATALRNALENVRNRHAGQSLAGIVVMTDGNATDWPDAGKADLTGLPPIYTIPIGSDAPAHDVAVTEARSRVSPFEDAPVRIEAIVQAKGYEGREVVAQLLAIPSRTNLSTQPKVVAESSQRAETNDSRLVFSFENKPDGSGLLFYQVRAAARDELSQFEPGKPTLEATLANNRRTVVADRGTRVHRILYVCGHPNWEFKFLNRALSDDAEMQLTALIRVARREAKFSFRGRSGESSNPLFRGFDRTNEETERYDQPVIIRLNTRDELELKEGFPTKAEDLYAFDAVVLDDLESAFFTSGQMQLLQRFVSERGGALLMLGGADSLAHGQYHRTAVGEMLPVYLDGPAQSKVIGPARLEVTREGMLESWLRQRGTEREELDRLKKLANVQIINEVRGIKPGAVTVMRLVDAKGATYPGLITQRFGRGRTAALTVGDLWHTGLGTEEGQKDLARFWRQLARWLVADVPGRVSVEVIPESADGEARSRLRVQVRDAAFQPVDQAAVTLDVQPMGGLTNGPLHLEADAVNEPGVYETSYSPREAGGYRVDVQATEPSGLASGRATAGFTSDAESEEFRSLNVNRTLLAELAQQTGGAMIELNDLGKLEEKIRQRPAPFMEPVTRMLWHRPLLLIAALTLLGIEWGLRRRAGLA